MAAHLRKSFSRRLVLLLDFPCTQGPRNFPWWLSMKKGLGPGPEEIQGRSPLSSVGWYLRLRMISPITLLGIRAGLGPESLCAQRTWTQAILCGCCLVSSREFTRVRCKFLLLSGLLDGDSYLEWRWTDVLRTFGARSMEIREIVLIFS